MRRYPRALFLTCIIVMIVYSAITLAAISAIPSDQLSQSGSPLADIVDNSYGGTGAVTISVIALFSTSNTILSNMLGSSRVLLSVGKETKLLRRFSYVSPKKENPVCCVGLHFNFYVFVCVNWKIRDDCYDCQSLHLYYFSFSQYRPDRSTKKKHPP